MTQPSTQIKERHTHRKQDSHTTLNHADLELA